MYNEYRETNRGAYVYDPLITSVDKYNFNVKSSRGGENHHVKACAWAPSGFLCDCGNFQFPMKDQEPGSCKHIDAILDEYEAKVEHQGFERVNSFTGGPTIREEAGGVFFHGSYRVKYRPDGTFSCTCYIYQDAGNCTHIEGVKSSFKPRTKNLGYERKTSL